eukprot:844582-Karenia_brevis.AAC.1
MDTQSSSGEEERETNAQKRRRLHEKEEVEVYMDDRTVVANQAATLVEGVQRWEAWSETVGLQENAGKKQL